LVLHGNNGDRILPSAAERFRTAAFFTFMSDESYYEGEARRCRELALSSPDPHVARRWHELADEYATLADEVASQRVGRPPLIDRLVLQPPNLQQSRTRAND
jgi:hypothetical protein